MKEHRHGIMPAILKHQFDLVFEYQFSYDFQGE